MTATYALTNALGFEIKTCSRCGGSGHYSYNQMHGSRCFGCGGDGVQYTKRGRAAREFWVASETVTAGEVQVGDRVIDGRTKFNVAAIETGFSGHRILQDGTHEPMAFVAFTSMQGNRFSYCPGIKVRVRRADAAEKLAAALAYQDTLTASGTPKKKAA
jgi:hypothetical protein